MNINLTKEEALSIIYSAFCNGGLNELYSCDVHMKEIPNAIYNKAKKNWLTFHKNTKTACLEDVYTQILRDGGSITFLDYNEEEKGKPFTMTLDSVIKGFSLPIAASDVLKTNEHEDDAWTGFNLFQYVLYGEVIYG